MGFGGCLVVVWWLFVLELSCLGLLFNVAICCCVLCFVIGLVLWCWFCLFVFV